MLKTGLSRLGDLTDFSALKGLFGGRRSPSISLYEAVYELPNGERWAEEILRNATGAGGVFMRTYAKRFEDFDSDVIALIRSHFGGQPIALHDLATSDARTSVDFFRKLDGITPFTAFVTSDICNQVEVLDGGEVIVTRDGTGTILEIAKPPFVFNMIKPESFRRYPLNLLFRELVARPAAKRALMLVHKGKIKPRRLQLVCREARDLSAANSRFRIVHYDLFDPRPPPPGHFAVIRAMNVLNPSYFDTAQLRIILTNVTAMLDEGGLFIVGSNDDAGSAVRGAAYERRGDRLVRVSGWRWVLPPVDAIVTGSRV